MSDERGEWAAPLPAAGADRLRAVAPALLLIAIAALGVRNHVVHDQSSWQGASFGMFATYDNAVSRQVVVTVTGPDGAERVALPPDLADDARRLRVLPTARGARSLAGSVAERVEPEGATSVEVAVWRIVLDTDDDLELRFEELRSETVEL